MELPKRKRNRLKEYDYSQSGAYFITICVKDKQNLLWRNKSIVGADIIRPCDTLHFDVSDHKLSEYGEIIDKAILKVSEHYSNLEINKYCIMPNHIHMIVFVYPNELVSESGRILSAPTTLSVTIGQLKRWVSKEIGFSLWQKSFHDHIIRNENEYKKIWQYIDENPLKWELDCYYDSK